MALLASDLIRQAYVLAQVWDPGEEQPGAEAQEGLLLLNTIINQWSSMGTFIPNYSTLTYNLNQGDYLENVTPQITDILEAHIVDSTNSIRRLTEVNLQRFNTFNFQENSGRPQYIYVSLDEQNIQTRSNLYFYPVADANYTATIYAKQILSELTYSQEISAVPLYYIKALKYQLARDMADVYLTVLSSRFDSEYQKIINDLKASNRKDLSVQTDNPFRTWRRYRPWNIYVG